MEYFYHLLVITSLFSIIGMSLNLVVGYTGLLSVVHAAFYGIGAYAAAILLASTNLPFLLVVLISVGVTSVVAFGMGVVLSRFRGDYYALASLGFGIIVYTILLNWQSLTGGAFGIFGIVKPEILGFTFTTGAPYAFLAFIAALLVYALSRFLVDSSFGRVLKAIRENESALAVFGYKTERYKLTVFVLAAALAALAGVLYGSYISFIHPSSFQDMVSIYMIVIVILGGLASLPGSVLGAAIFILLPEFLRFLGLPDDIAAHMRQALYGVALIVLMFVRPQGILGSYKL